MSIYTDYLPELKTTTLFQGIADQDIVALLDATGRPGTIWTPSTAQASQRTPTAATEVVARLWWRTTERLRRTTASAIRASSPTTRRTIPIEAAIAPGRPIAVVRNS